MTRVEQVREGEVPAELVATYRDIRQVLRVPYVPLLFRAVAAHEGALKPLWRTMRPLLSIRAFEDAADDVRVALAKAAFELGTPLIEPMLLGAGLDVDDLDDVRAHIGTFHYVDAKLLLCTTLLDELLEGQTVGGARRADPDLLLPVPEGPVEDFVVPALLPEEPMGLTGGVFRTIIATTHLPIATVDLRAFGNWPTFLRVAWSAIGPIFEHPELGRQIEAIERQTRGLLAEQPVAVRPPELSDASRRALRRTVDVLADAMPRVSLFVAALKVAFDGVEEAFESPAAVDWGERPIDSLPI